MQTKLDQKFSTGSLDIFWIESAKLLKYRRLYYIDEKLGGGLVKAIIPQRDYFSLAHIETC